MNKLYTLLFLLLTFATVQAQKTFIHCGNLIDGKSNEVQTQVTIIVEGNKIIEIEKGFSKPGKDDKLIDLSKKTVMPGAVCLSLTRMA